MKYITIAIGVLLCVGVLVGYFMIRLNPTTEVVKIYKITPFEQTQEHSQHKETSDQSIEDIRTSERDERKIQQADIVPGVNGSRIMS